MLNHLFINIIYGKITLYYRFIIFIARYTHVTDTVSCLQNKKAVVQDSGKVLNKPLSNERNSNLLSVMSALVKRGKINSKQLIVFNKFNEYKEMMLGCHIAQVVKLAPRVQRLQFHDATGPGALCCTFSPTLSAPFSCLPMFKKTLKKMFCTGS